MSARLVQRFHWRRVAAGLGLVAGAAALIGIVISAGAPGSSKGANTTAKSSGSATVQRRDLVATDTESGTLSYADAQTVYNRVTGTVTWLPTVGHVIKPGQTLYKVDNAPVVLFNGNVPAYRSLSDGVTDGPDVKELEQNLRALGYDPNHDMTIDDTFDSATTAAVDRWQAAMGSTQTGTITLGQIVFLPGPQRITSIDTVLGSNGSSSGSGSGSGSGSSASVAVAPAHPEFVDLTTTTTTTPSTTSSCASTTTTTTPTTTSSCSSTTTTSSTTTSSSGGGSGSTSGSGSGKPGSGSTPSSLAALLALLKADTLELKKNGSATGSGAGAGKSGTGASGSGAAAGSGGSGGSGSGSGSGSGAGSGSGSGSGTGSSSGSGSGSSAAQAILGTTSTQLVVTVDLDATKQSEAVVGEPVTVELPDGSAVDGKISEVSPVAQSSSSSSSGSGSSGSGSGSGSGSNQPSATIPVTITLKGRHPKSGLDQAAVSVNFEQQKANNVLSVPVTALLATAGGGYAVQDAVAPHRLIPVTPGLFAAGYVQISGSQIYPGLQVTDSQG